MTANTPAISTETLLQLVVDPQRRTVLHHLRENGDGAVAIDELTETIAADGGDPPVRHAPNDTRAFVELYHTHLPKLAEAGLVEYDRRSGTVRYHSHERVEDLLQFVSTRLE